ncbi:hypothetical protein L0244_02635 [bacterium]|nr:hypothetical protein [bacterium]
MESPFWQIDWEEEILFPLFEKKTGMSNAEEELLISILNLHNMKEENVLYPVYR